MENLRRNLLNRGFPKTLMKSSIDKARNESGIRTRDDSSETVALILNYDPAYKNTQKILEECLQWLNRDPLGQAFLARYRPMVAYR